MLAAIKTILIKSKVLEYFNSWVATMNQSTNQSITGFYFSHNKINHAKVAARIPGMHLNICMSSILAAYSMQAILLVTALLPVIPHVKSHF